MRRWEANVASDAARKAYENISFALSRDEDDDVLVAEDGLLVHGTLFAFLDEDDLVVELPDARASDLKARGIALPFRATGRPSRDWVRISDQELWSELASEAHEYVGEPPVGGES